MTNTITTVDVHRGVGLHRSPTSMRSHLPFASYDAIPGENCRAELILVVEDDPIMRRAISGYLEDHNVRVVSTSRGSEATRYLAAGDVGLVLLDLVLGEEDGLDVLREIRRHSDVPVIIITGHRRGEADKIVALGLGADDYVTKPFSVRELLARIRAVLRRQEIGRMVAHRDTDQGRCRFGGWLLDRRARSLTDPNGAAVALTKGEYALLTAFLNAPQRPLSREHLLQATRIREDVFDRSIDVQILRLRRKLEADASAPRIIRTERGVGYVFVPPVEQL